MEVRCLLLVVFWGCFFVETFAGKGKTVLHFDNATWDFGRISETKGKVTHTFHFTNIHTSPIVIEEVVSTCGCAIPAYSKRPVMPGKTGAVTITFDPKGQTLKLINDILDLSKIESGRLNYNVSEVELRDICQEAYVVQSLKMTSDVALLYNSVAMPSVRLWIDPHRVEQVLLNLLSNAIKFTSKGFISLFYEVEDMFVRVSVMDTGIGISEEKLESVFERFVKLDDFYQGAGLGLPICKMIVEQLGGEIGVRSELGKGSTFWFTLPLVVTDKAVV